MPRPDPTEIRINEDGTETHESWLLIRANTVTCQPGARLFDSEIAHQHIIRVTITRCTRKRDLQRDWLSNDELLMEIEMSQAQWGAFVSSFGSGTGVPATLHWFGGELIPGVSTGDSRLDLSHREVLGAATRAMQDVRQAHTALQAAFDRGAGKKEMRELLRALEIRMGNLPSNMEFAAKSLTEHVENVVTKARYDIETMATQAAQQGRELESGTLAPFAIQAGA